MVQDLGWYRTWMVQDLRWYITWDGTGLGMVQDLRWYRIRVSQKLMVGKLPRISINGPNVMRDNVMM